jgi:hypothetical protein
MIPTGTILMDKDALRPQCFQLEDSSYSKWMSVRHDLNARELEKELEATGWTFFYMASPVTTTAFGFDRAKMMQSALKRLIREVELQDCNCLEIDNVAARSFLGLPYISVSAHPRHIQTGKVFSRN